MRLWSLHPRYLDARGLVALWREALLAQAVLLGKTRGYTHHPQLERFRAARNPAASIAAYLRAVHDQAARRGYAFAADKIGRARGAATIPVARGQLAYEWEHLSAKLTRRDPAKLAKLLHVKRPQAHPLFRVVRGGVATWEKTSMPRPTRSRTRR